jgi:hypothetical protein
MKRLIILAITLSFCRFLNSQTVNEIINTFISTNEVQYEYIGHGSVKSPAYQNFLLLKKTAGTDKLIELTNHNNPVVRCYAGWALIDNKYSELPTVFKSFLDNDSEVTTFTLDMKDKDKISVEFYHRYWNSVEILKRSSDLLLLKLDSIALYHPKSEWLLILRALDNRIYPKKYDRQIEFLAFNKCNRDALFYLSNWYKAKYVDRLKKGFTDYLQKTEFKKVGVTQYFQIVSELLKFKDESIDSLILNKLRHDKHWQFQKQRFIDLLQDYSIYESDFQ